ncbi:nucleoside hydrolase [Mycetocola spongiae]|uniref:nucleoside hydrolase n=1 Tax=Mycetocola spongiae TaxID=2859226 RepID=UPI001CF12B36|nr:nucleoside hydrolase [Mycetocola spongiae]UCR88869.1 nucleoside hydrolase [Mycetocola spongiae]
MTTSPARRPVFLDCDTGIDDALALALLLASPEIELVGIGSVSGNTSAERGAINTLDLLALAGRTDIPVALGAHDPLSHPFNGGVPHIHGHNGIGDVQIPDSGREVAPVDAAQLLIDLAHEHGGALELITIGPVTNIAHALRRDPALAGLIREVTLMGGAAMVPGNVTPLAEANIWNDPEAFAVMLEAEWDLVLVPLDVTMENVFTEEDRQALLASPSPFAQALGNILDLYFNFYVSVYGHRSCALHDPLAVALAVGTVTATRAPAVDMVVDTTDGPGRGQTICDLRAQRLGTVDTPGVRTRVVLDTDVPLAPILLQRILDFSNALPRD